MSVLENCRSGLDLPEGYHGQVEEWLAGGFIHESRIAAVWPFDGREVVQKEGAEATTSSNNQEWEFDSRHKIWRSKLEMKKWKEKDREEKQKKKADRQQKKFTTRTRDWDNVYQARR